MSEERRYPTGQLGRQPDPEPPGYTAPPPPSLLLYLGLLIFALVLLVVALGLGTQDWAGFLLNLSTEIIGAIIILLLVEHRLRSSDIQLLQSLPETTRYAVTDWILADTVVVRAYVRVLARRIESAARPFYLPRPRSRKSC